jgi:FdhE protein
MDQKGEKAPDRPAVSEASGPPFAVVPNATYLFSSRATRFHKLAEASSLGPYLTFLGRLSEVQAASLAGLPEPNHPSPDDIARAREFGMPPLLRTCTTDPALEATFDRLFALAREIDQPPPAAEALSRVSAATPAERKALADRTLAGTMPAESLADNVYIASALQVHFARLAARLFGPRLLSLGDGICPACGGPPATTMIVGWPGAHSARFCACPLCGTLWNVVRIKCILCGSTEGIGYREVDGHSVTIKAETCDHCHGWVKILRQDKDPAIEPIADDVASLGLDLLMKAGPYHRGGVNPFLAGY